MTTTLSPAAQAEIAAMEAQQSRRTADPRCRTVWRIVANCLHFDSEGVGSKMLNASDRIAALKLCDGFGATDNADQLFDWSHVRDSSEKALEAVALFLLSVFARQTTARDYARRLVRDFPCVDHDTIRELVEIVELAHARAVMRAMPRALRRLTRRGAPLTRGQVAKLADRGILFVSGSPTQLGYRVRDGWLCERCCYWGDAGETYYSAEHCNETGTDVALCEPCAVKANAERELGKLLQSQTVAP